MVIAVISNLLLVASGRRTNLLRLPLIYELVTSCFLAHEQSEWTGLEGHYLSYSSKSICQVRVFTDPSPELSVVRCHVKPSLSDVFYQVYPFSILSQARAAPLPTTHY